MNRFSTLIAIVALAAIIAMGCSGGGNNPVTPGGNTNLTAAGITGTQDSAQTHLWGYYDVYFDFGNNTVKAVENRSAMFAANVVSFLNKNPMGLAFKINDTPIGTDYIDVDIDVTITHPIPGAPQYNGYDVRGIFIGNGSGSLSYNSDLEYPVFGSDQWMFNADGYTRWFNPGEFNAPGLFGYMPGKFASPAFNGSATLNPYKYFADGLGATDDIWEFLNSTDGNGVFGSGMSNTRNYLLRFPKSGGIKYNYAVVADWKGEDLVNDHPANAPEAVAGKVNVTDNVYYVDADDNGGDLILDINAFGWDYQPSAITVESSVLESPYQLNETEMTPTGGEVNYSTYHVEIPADSVISTNGNEYWVIFEYSDFTYANDYGVPNNADSDTLAAFFRYDLYVANEPYNVTPVIDGIEDDIIGGGSYKNPVEITDTAVTYTALYTDPDAGQAHEITWFIVLDGNTPTGENIVTMPIDWSTYATGEYDIHVDVSDGIAVGHGGPFDITRNTLPVIDSGVDGNAAPFMGSTEVYSVAAHDDDSDPITWSWTVTDSSMVEVISDDPGNGDGTINIDWKAIGATDGAQYDIDCVVTDGLANIDATTLSVTTTKYLLNYNATTDAEGPMTVLASLDTNHKWTYKSAMTAWDESTTATYPTAYVTILGTPVLNFPTGYSNIHLEIEHWGNSEYEWDGGFIGYTTNGGTTYTLNGPTPGTTFLSYVSGTNFNGSNNWYPPQYASQWSWNCNWMRLYAYTGWANKYWSGGNGGGAAWGSQTTPVTSNWTMNSLAGTSNIQICFDFCSDWVTASTGWSIKAVRIYVD